jgi:tetratricopeptide (TPR) repeat protein
MRLFCILILLLTACTPGPKSNEISPAQHRQWAVELLAIHDYPGALKELRLTLAGNPNIDDALLYADLLEAQGEAETALRVYKKAVGYPADEPQKQALSYRLALLQATQLENLKAAENLLSGLPPVDSRFFDLKSVLLLRQGQLKAALAESQRALSQATNNEEKGWAYFHLAQIYFELRNERETFGALFNAVNNGRGYSLVAQITDYWENLRRIPFPKN